jgi:hypothetical protein
MYDLIEASLEKWSGQGANGRESGEGDANACRSQVGRTFS